MSDDLFDPDYKSSFGSIFESAKPEAWQTKASPLDLAVIHETAGRAITTMAEMPCGGDRSRLSACTSTVERSCAKRKCNSCPREIMHFEALHGRLRRGDRSELQGFTNAGISSPIAAQMAARTFEESNPAMVAVNSWWLARPRPPALLLLGGPGSGKTFAASYMVGWHSGRMVRVADLVSGASTRGYLESLRFVGLLAVDDVGTERLDGFDTAKAVIGEVICQRMDAGVMTVITSNLDTGSIRNRYGDRMADRLRDLGLVKSVTGNFRSLARFASSATHWTDDRED